VVQHVDEQFAAGMAEWLNQSSPLPVRIAQDGARPLPGCVALAGTNHHLVLDRAARLRYTPEPRGLVYRPSVDVFFESVNAHWRSAVTGVLLTGMGQDGARGLKALRDAGHYTIAQDRSSSAVYGMPKAAAELGAAADVLAVDKIAAALQERFASR
jgi:two-component system, chemotaxis family, response regulator WspF